MKIYFHITPLELFLAMMIGLVIVVVFPAIVKVIRRRFPQAVSSIEKCSRSSHFDPDGTVIRTISSPVYYVKTVLMFVPIVGVASLAYLLLLTTDAVLIVMAVVFCLCSVFLAAFWVSYVRRCTCYLSIDERGIKGRFCNIYNLVIPRFEEIDITWEQVNKVILIKEEWGRYHTFDVLKIYTGKSPKLKTRINLELFPSRKVIDSINFYYAQKLGTQEPESPLIEYKLEDNRTLRYLLGLGMFALILLIALLIN